MITCSLRPSIWYWSVGLWLGCLSSHVFLECALMMLEASSNVTRLRSCSFCAPSFASWSALSFPLMPQCAGTHWSMAVFTVALRDCREAVRGFVSLFREFCIIGLNVLGSSGSENTWVVCPLCVCVCVRVSVCLFALERRNYRADFNETFQKWSPICLVVCVWVLAH